MLLTKYSLLRGSLVLLLTRLSRSFIMTYDLAGKQPAIPFGSLVLVTGVTGLIGGHVANEFLRAGYNVRGTTRRASKAQWSVDYFTKQYGPGRYEVVEVSDLSKPENFNDALKGTSA